MTNINKFTLSLFLLYVLFMGVFLFGISIFWPFNSVSEIYRWATGVLGIFFVWLGGFSDIDIEKTKFQTQVKTLKLKTTSEKTATDIIQELNKFSEEPMLSRFKKISKKYSNNTTLINSNSHFHNIIIEGKEVANMISQLNDSGLCPKPHKYTYNGTQYYTIVYLLSKRQVKIKY